MNKFLIAVAVILLLNFGLHKLGCIKLPSTNVTSSVDPSKGVTVTPAAVDFTDAKGVKKHIKKPIEGRVILGPTIKIQEAGFCLIPKAGFNSTGRWYAGARVFFWDDAGIELMGNDQKLFLGADYRVPCLNLLTVAAGTDTPLNSLQFGIYFGASATLLLQ